MAKAAKTTYTLNVGDKVTFVKYGQPLEKGQKPLFKKGDTGTIISQDELSKDKNDPYESYTVRNSKGQDENLFYPEEITGQDAPAAKSEEAAPAKKAAAKTAAKKAPTKAAAKAPAKAAAKKAGKPAQTADTEDGGEQLIMTDKVAALLEETSAVEAARELLNNVSTSYFTLGGVLAHIQATEAFTKVQVTGGKKGERYTDFMEFCATELGQDSGKVYQLIRIYRKLSAAGIDEAAFRGIGWTYAREMSKVITSENADDLLANAQDMGRDEFVNYVKKTYVKDSPTASEADKISRIRYSFTVHGDQADAMSMALKKLGKKLGTDDNGILFHHMAIAFLQEEGATSLEQDKAFFEETHGVTLEVTGKRAKAAPAKAAAKAPAKKATAKAPAKKAAKARA